MNFWKYSLRFECQVNDYKIIFGSGITVTILPGGNGQKAIQEAIQLKLNLSPIFFNNHELSPSQTGKLLKETTGT